MKHYLLFKGVSSRTSEQNKHHVYFTVEEDKPPVGVYEIALSEVKVVETVGKGTCMCFA